MFAIDLLKGQGIPEKSGAKGIIVGVIGFAVPVIIGIVFSGMYLSDAVAISVKKQEIGRFEKKTENLSDALRIQKSFEQKRNAMQSVLSEVSSSLDRHTQWSQVLVTIVKTIPDSLVMTGLEAEQDFKTKRRPKRGNPDEMENVSIPIRILKIRVKGKTGSNHDEAVREFCSKLRSSKGIGSRLKNIKIAKRNLGDRKEKGEFYYEVICLFKEGL